MKATKPAMTDALPYALPAVAGLLALFLAPAVEQFDARVERQLRSG